MGPKQPSPQSRLAGFIAKYDPKVARVARQALGKMRKLQPGAVELVYDNYNALAIGFGPTERASELIFSIALYPRWVSLFFAHGVGLPDPHGLLQGSGSRFRHIVLESAATLDRLPVRALLRQALKNAGREFRAGQGRIVVKSVSAKQRPRRPTPDPRPR